LPFCIGLGGRPYNSVNISTLHCDWHSHMFDRECPVLHCEFKKTSRHNLAHTSPNVDWFSKFFYWRSQQ